MNARKKVSAWPLLVLSLPAFVAVWSGWVGLGQMTGFGEVEIFPGLSTLKVNTSITLPLGAEALGVIAARAWLSPDVCQRARIFAYRLLWAAALYGAAGQAAYHLMRAAGWQRAPWPVTLGVSVLPVGVIVLGLILFHMIHYGEDADLVEPIPQATPVEVSVEVPAVAPVAIEPSPVVWEQVGTGGNTPAPAGEPVSVTAPDDVDPSDRGAVVAWVAAQDPRPSDRTIGRTFGRSRSWGKGVLAEVSGASKGDGRQDSRSEGEDDQGTDPGDEAVRLQPVLATE